MHLRPAHLSQPANVFTQHAARSSIHLPGAARPHWGPPSSLRPVLSSGRRSKLSQQLLETAHFHFPFCCWASSDLPERPLHLSLGKMAQAENHSINSSITADGDALLCIYLQSIYRGCCPFLFCGVKKTFCALPFFFSVTSRLLLCQFPPFITAELLLFSSFGVKEWSKCRSVSSPRRLPTWTRARRPVNHR